MFHLASLYYLLYGKICKVSTNGWILGLDHQFLTSIYALSISYLSLILNAFLSWSIVLFQVIGECHASQVDDDVAAKYRLVNGSQETELLLEFWLHTLLYQPPHQWFENYPWKIMVLEYCSWKIYRRRAFISAEDVHLVFQLCRPTVLQGSFH